MKRFLKLVAGGIGLCLIFILILLETAPTWMNLTPPEPPTPTPSPAFTARETLFVDSGGMRHALLSGSAYEKGQLFGRQTKDILERQENALIEKMNSFFGNRFFQKLFFSFAALYFHGLDQAIDTDHRLEMLGVSESTTSKYNSLASPYTRQVAYHALHEVGQMMIDESMAHFGCTTFVLPQKEGLMVGRAFDFEADRIFDDEKIIKWVFPPHPATPNLQESSYAYASVIWAGMVGVVTGVNEKGVFISINAAGSDDSQRIGEPTTLVVARALEKAKNAEEAKNIIRESKTFITDIFVVADKTGTAFRIEKSPHRTEVQSLESPHVVTNHLLHPSWNRDKTNQRRMLESTTLSRAKRGEELLVPFLKKEIHPSRVIKMVELLRDRSAPGGQPLHLGHRSAINPLIATHGIVYDSKHQRLYVSLRHSLSGRFLGYDLNASFQTKTPTWVETIREDPTVSTPLYQELLALRKNIDQVKNKLKSGHCNESLLSLVASPLESYQKEIVLGDIEMCLDRRANAKIHWKRALEMKPAYLAERKYLEEKLQ